MGRGYATRRDAQAAAQARIDALLAQARDAAVFPTVSELISDYRVLRPGKGGGRERVAWALGKIEARFGAIRVDQITAREVEVWIAGLDTPSTRWEVSRVFRQLFSRPPLQRQEPCQSLAPAAAGGGEAVQRPRGARADRDRAGRVGRRGPLRRCNRHAPEEWIPLEPPDVNDEAQTVTIRRTFTEGKGLEQFAGKTVGSIRTVPLSAAAVAAYQSQRRRNPDSPLVFPAPRGGYLNLRNWRDRDWHPALEAAGVDPRGPNALRHTFATWFLLHSDDRWLLAKLMGTSVNMIEAHYGHLLAPHATRSRDILDAIWDGFGRKLDATRESSNGQSPVTPSRLGSTKPQTRSPLTDSNR
jgi:hypothetical protein